MLLAFTNFAFPKPGDWRRELAMKECGDNFYKYQKALAGSESTYSRRKVSTKRQKSDEVLDRGNHRHSGKWRHVFLFFHFDVTSFSQCNDFFNFGIK